MIGGCQGEGYLIIKIFFILRFGIGSTAYLDPGKYYEEHVVREWIDGRHIGQTNFTPWFGVEEETCHCDCNDGNRRFPGCDCENNYRTCVFNGSCDEWPTVSKGNDTFMFHHFDMTAVMPNVKFGVFSYFVRAYSTTYLSNRATTFSSKYFEYSGLGCKIAFRFLLVKQTFSTKISLTLTQDEETSALWSFGDSNDVWMDQEVYIGAHETPFRLNFLCESGRKPKVKRKETNNSVVECAVTAIHFSGCDVDYNSVKYCSTGEMFVCDGLKRKKCVKDAECDLKFDCDDGSDEWGCENLPLGSRCDFGEMDVETSGWKFLTQFYGNSKVFKRDIGKVESAEPKNLFQVSSATLKGEIRRPARDGAGPFLLYSHLLAVQEQRQARTTVFLSPIFPPTNPDAYNRSHPLYRSCKLRYSYYVNGVAFPGFSIKIIRAHGDPFKDGGQEFHNALALDHFRQSAWNRKNLPIPKQLTQFRLAIFATFMEIDAGVVLGLDDISISPQCFRSDLNSTYTRVPEGFSYLPAKVLVDSCDHSGVSPPTYQECNERRLDDGFAQISFKNDGSQVWKAEESRFYRLEACGAAGGKRLNLTGSSGDCVVAVVYLKNQTTLEFLIGQMGESPCQYSSKGFDCTRNGAGGGGATVVKIGNRAFLIAGGGAGASHFESSTYPKNITNSGYGASSSIPTNFNPNCSSECQKATPTTFSKAAKCSNETIFGGFGGGGSSCDEVGGGGAGYFGGAAGSSGSSFIDPDFSATTHHVGSFQEGNGLVIITTCNLNCEFPTICRFHNASSEKQYCACPNGEEFLNETSMVCAHTPDECPLSCNSPAECVILDFLLIPACRCPNRVDLIDENEFCFEATSIDYIYKFLLIGIIFLLVLFSASWTCVRRKSQKNKAFSINPFLMQNMDDGHHQIYNEVQFGTISRHEALKELPQIDKEQLSLGSQKALGRGNFGQVIHGVYRREDGGLIDVAIKIIEQAFTSNAQRQADLMNEALCMGHFKHRNITELIGVNFNKIPYIIVVEYMAGGDLLTFLQRATPTEDDLNPMHLSMNDLLRIADDVASGCALLEEKEYVHRDIAARNILLTQTGFERIAKIADFGMARYHQPKDGFEFYQAMSSTLMPVKWTAPEAYIDGKFSSKSDVWSYGILCWEIFSLGVVPYPDRNNDETIVAVTSGERLEYPYGCPYKVYLLMRRCWETQTENRPTFSEIKDFIEQLFTDNVTMSTPFPVHPYLLSEYLKKGNHVEETYQPSQIGVWDTPLETPSTVMTELLNTPGATEDTWSDALLNYQIDVSQKQALDFLINRHETPFISEKAKEFLDSLRKQVDMCQAARKLRATHTKKEEEEEKVAENYALLAHTSTVERPTSLNMKALDDSLAVAMMSPEMTAPARQFEDNLDGPQFLSF
ncbi:unnamed protein product [Caenorhabditis auriculariae]|uniref:receptor protein-tyrosine kinase n=1 Tax=Caenorhabditis auriculariae TaxID=2777116 RepID=A0A8S1HW70_9PELO|nr:unnamed protein product [Caenorhabditis auriculariae]